MGPWSRAGAVHGPPGSGGARGVPTQFNLLPLGGAGFLARDHLVRRGARRAAVLAVPARVATVARVVKNHLRAALALVLVCLGVNVAAARRAVCHANLIRRGGRGGGVSSSPCGKRKRWGLLGRVCVSRTSQGSQAGVELKPAAPWSERARTNTRANIICRRLGNECTVERCARAKIASTTQIRTAGAPPPRLNK